MKTLFPYLLFTGQCRQAMEFYAHCLGGEITIMQTCGDSPINFPPEAADKIFNSEMRAGNLRIKASDNPAKDGQSISDPPISLFVSFTDRPDFEAATERLATGGRVTMNQEGHFVMLTDQFGFSWMLTTDAPTE